MKQPRFGWSVSVFPYQLCSSESGRIEIQRFEMKNETLLISCREVANPILKDLKVRDYIDQFHCAKRSLRSSASQKQMFRVLVSSLVS